MEFLTTEENESALSRIQNPTHRVQWLLMADAGLRVTEVCNLRWADIDVRKKVIKIKSLKKREDTSRVAGRQKTREVPMSSRLYQALTELVQKKGKGNGFLFPGNSDPAKPITRISVNKWMRELADDNPDLPHIHPHKLRHTFATKLRVQGAELEDIRDALGHEKLDTSLIYAHADKEKLRTMIDATAPKPSVWQRIKRALFRVREYRLNLSTAITPDLVGRDEEAKRIERLLQQGVSVIVTGSTGVGKSFLVDSLNYPKKVLEIDDHKDFKKSLAACLVHLLGSKEEVAKLVYGTDNPDALIVKASKESMPNLCRLMQDACERKEYILKINDLESVTPSIVRVLEILKDHFVILTTARSVKMNNSSFLWDFEKIDLKPLSRPDSLRLFHRLTNDLELHNRADGSVEWIQNKIHDTAAGANLSSMRTSLMKSATITSVARPAKLTLARCSCWCSAA